MKISVFGLGYVGTVSAACLAKAGHTVIGVDPNETKVSLINDGHSPIIEKDVAEIIAAGIGSGHLSATHDAAAAVAASEISLICVGTPSQLNGNLDLSFVRRVCEDIGRALVGKDSYHVVVVRSTMLPGSVGTVVIPTLERASGRSADSDFGICINPEFLREGSAVADYYNPPKTVIGSSDDRAGDLVSTLYEDMSAPLIRTTIAVAELSKYVDNAWHALKVAFANEIGAIGKAVGVDSHDVMNIFIQDEKLNLSSAYLRPGFAFGGSCLPKDLRAINYKAKTLDLDVPLLRSVLPSNRVHIDRAMNLIQAAGNKKVTILGLSFKAGTDDLRESPVLEIVERLLGKGFDIRILDRNVEIASLTGANRDYLLNHIPHISSLLVSDVNAVLEHGDTIVVGNASEEFASIVPGLDSSKQIIDLVRISRELPSAANYTGIAW